jgi:2,3-bisphosphoglycerate-independent phosphoglycerate mutase
VPFAISSVGLMVNEQAGTNDFGIKDGVELYDEVSCGQGSLGRFSGCEAIEFMKNFTGFVNSKI